MKHNIPFCTGNSVCAFVHGFQPYFYIEAPRGFGPDDCDSLCSQLNVRSSSEQAQEPSSSEWQSMRGHRRACKCSAPCIRPFKSHYMLQYDLNTGFSTVVNIVEELTINMRSE